MLEFHNLDDMAKHLHKTKESEVVGHVATKGAIYRMTKTGAAQPIEFDSFENAFSYCRDLGQPIRVDIKGDGKYKLFPSGRADRLGPTDRAVKEGIDEIIKELESEALAEYLESDPADLLPTESGNVGRPKRETAKAKPIWVGQITDKERERILKWLTPKERFNVLYDAALAKSLSSKK